MYPLPPELSAKIFAILNDKTNEQDKHDHIAALFVRENRRMRQQIATLWREFSKIANRDDVDYGTVMATGGCEFLCEYIINKIIKPNVYFNSAKAEDHVNEIDRIIEDFYKENDDYGL